MRERTFSKNFVFECRLLNNVKYEMKSIEGGGR